MGKKQIISIISIIIILIAIAIGTILVVNKNSETKKTAVAGNTMEDQESIEVEETPEEPILEETPTVTPSPTPTATPKPTPTPPPSIMYYIKVNNQMNTVTVYKKDDSGNYTIPVKAMVCSTGWATPKNTKHTLKAFRREWNLMNGGVYAQYVTQVVGDICFHSVPYFKRNKATLEYLLYDKLGTTCSAGCIRLTTADAIWIYNNCAAGTTVEFYSSSNPGPLGKPSAMKISGYTQYRNWDPTDPDPNNPWKNANLNTETPEPTPEATSTPTVTPSVEPTSEVSPVPTNTPTTTPSDIPSETPTVVPTPVATPTETLVPEDND